MTKRLEALFDLAPVESDDDTTHEQVVAITEEQKTTISEIDNAIDKIDLALPFVNDLDTSDAELDELAKLAKDNFSDLMSLGMNVEARFSGTIFQTAGVLLGHAITAKQAKLDKKLKMVDLQLKKMRLDYQINKDNQGTDESIEGEAQVLDRNSLLAQILNRSSNNSKN
ncbi:hypothetical protein EBZ57_03445 [bacterium]|nr:hypothetical protein [bacterium]